jgi:hypothetical protein
MAGAAGRNAPPAVPCLPFIPFLPFRVFAKQIRVLAVHRQKLPTASHHQITVSVQVMAGFVSVNYRLWQVSIGYGRLWQLPGPFAADGNQGQGVCLQFCRGAGTAFLDSLLDFQAGEKVFQPVDRGGRGGGVEMDAQIIQRVRYVLDRTRQRRAAGVGVAAAL